MDNWDLSLIQVFCVVLMIFAACLFATILGEVQSIYTSVCKKNQDVEDQLQSIANFLSVNKSSPPRQLHFSDLFHRVQLENDIV